MERSIYVEQYEDRLPELVIPLDTRWQEFTLTRDFLRITIPPACWEAQNVGAKP
jgi:hypothetical protein